MTLFAGLEAVYASMAHASQDRIVAHNLFRLYQRAREDLILVRETLCDPFVPLTTREPAVPIATASSAALFAYREKAHAVGLSLDALVSVCQCRCQLIQHQLTLWNTDSLDFDDASSLFQTIQPPIHVDISSHASPVVQRVGSELEVWFHLTDMASSLCKYG